jgi:hypothetical protein
MAKLHELLAVETNLANQAEKCRTELITSTFDKKRHHFSSKRITFTPNTENAVTTTEEQSDIQTSIRSELVWIAAILAKAWDASYQIDSANMLAVADVIIEDEASALLTRVPATFLLQLEKHLKEMHDLLRAVPTLDPAKGFQPDPQREAGVYKAREVHKTRTKKNQRPMVLYEATKEHPAQVTMVTEDIAVGEILEQEWSSLITPVQKSDMLDRCDKLIRAVKRARSKANEQDLDVTKSKIAKPLLDYLLQPVQ